LTEKKEISEELYAKFDAVLLTEIIYRAIKIHIDFKLRKVSSYLPIEDEYRREVSKILKQFEDNDVWKNPGELKQLIQFKFGDYALFEDELKDDFNLKSILRKDEFRTMVCIYCNISGSHVQTDLNLNAKVKNIFKWVGQENEFMQYYIRNSESEDLSSVETVLLRFIPKIHTFKNWDTVFMFLKLFLKVTDNPDNMNRVLEVVQENSYLWNDQSFLDDFILNFILTTIKRKFPSLITNQIIQNIPQPKSIKNLDLGGCIFLDDEAFINCNKLINLVELNISGTKVTDETLKKIARLGQFLNLEKVNVSSCPNITEEGIALLNFCELIR